MTFCFTYLHCPQMVINNVQAPNQEILSQAPRVDVQPHLLVFSSLKQPNLGLLGPLQIKALLHPFCHIYLSKQMTQRNVLGSIHEISRSANFLCFALSCGD